ncbi:MAG: SGNH/GDSL hydrolase family protein [Lentisphaerae bacterium]|jgi:lysophospholipase L1-like esterase|nr:SGNH/GDSL hydrolase family protein [Lentisphaerota bacterium]MBT4820093.1 SGNH/GDSL hydrolase family protein [Lentisphaerota bacterium]MBT5605743.1 SGNH/GDSL hydrolase family protein [Lentisphaerota bacterium]MBT7053934.1 SGNH/GDSL hydrolase family protein [Lentisphaerota bacterium]MBT7843924.1 SGNH/GDSL hydrolase family protein [Lentisphaerota bacterium]
MQRMAISRVVVVAAVLQSACLLRAAEVTIPVDSPAVVFSPGNWVGDSGRGGERYRQTWNPGAYARITWESTAKSAAPTLLLDTSTYDGTFKPPILACNLDGVWAGNFPCAAEIPIPEVKGTNTHVLTVYLKKSTQVKRWGMPGVSGLNVVRITGLKVAEGSKPIAAAARPKWALIVGDSITEGCGAYELEGYSHLVGQALVTQGYEYTISACGWSGWLNRGDRPPGDVPGYYVVTGSVDGTGGVYDEAASRWNKIDANHSLLDAQSRISAYGGTDQEPGVILINYGTNDVLHRSNASDVVASMEQCLMALRDAAPAAHIVFVIPFGQYKAAEIHRTVRDYQAAHPDDQRILVIDLGPGTARALRVKKGYWGGLHPNARAHATFAAQIVAQLMVTLN